jgi:uncharacterized protein
VDLLITDWHFYLVAIPAVLILSLSKSGFGSGFGSLAVPLMSIAVPVPQAAAILLPVLFAIDVSGQTRLWQHINWRLIRFLIPCGLVGTVIGYLLMTRISSQMVAGIVGLLTLLFLAQRLLLQANKNKHLPKWLGGLLTITAGFTSFVAHAGGPPISFYVIPLQMAPLVYTATMGSFFFAINLSKWIPYAALGLFDWRNLATSLALLPIVPFGVWLGVRLAATMKQDVFYKILYTGMFLTGCKLLWDGLK